MTIFDGTAVNARGITGKKSTSFTDTEKYEHFTSLKKGDTKQWQSQAYQQAE